MGNSRLFHDFRPLGVRANQDPDPPPRVGRGPASGRHTEEPFRRAASRARPWGRGAREGSRREGLHRRHKVPPAVGDGGLRPAGQGEQCRARTHTPDPKPHFGKVGCTPAPEGSWGKLRPGGAVGRWLVGCARTGKGCGTAGGARLQLQAAWGRGLGGGSERGRLGGLETLKAAGGPVPQPEPQSTWAPYAQPCRERQSP